MGNTDASLYPDGSSYMQDGVRYAVAAGVTLYEVIGAQSLPRGTLSQKEKLIALT